MCSDVFAADNVSEGEDDVSAELDVDVFRCEACVTGTLL